MSTPRFIHTAKRKSEYKQKARSNSSEPRDVSAVQPEKYLTPMKLRIEQLKEARAKWIENLIFLLFLTALVKLNPVIIMQMPGFH